LKREEAVNLLQEIIQHCTSFESYFVALMPPDSDDLLSHGYQLHIKGIIAQANIDCIVPIVEKYKLAIENEPQKDVLIIYKSLKKG
jgi:hypothetical protein